MSVDDRYLARLRGILGSSPTATQVTEGCLSQQVIWETVRGEPPPGRRREAVDHVLSCAACTQSWQLAHALAQEAGRPGEAGRDSRGLFAPAPATWWRTGGLIAAAASVVIMVAVGFHLRNDAGREAPPLYRAGNAEAIESLLPEGRFLSRDDCILRWSPGPPGTRYDLLVATEDLMPLATARGLLSSEYRVPAEAFAGLPPDARVIWQIDAVHPDGRRVSSRTFVSSLD